MSEKNTVIMIAVTFFLLGVLVFFYIRRTYRIEDGTIPSKGLRYLPACGAIFAFRLPIFLCAVLVIGGKRAVLLFLPALIIFGVYTCLLAMVLPFLRKFISAKICAWLWVLPYLPAYFVVTQHYWKGPRLLTITLPADLTALPRWVGILWLIGFSVVLLWQIVSHFAFKAELLKYSVPVSNDDTIRLWAREQDLLRFPGDSIKLRISSRTQTPLSIGLFRRTTYVILPERDYTPEELRLIFRHELIHISRMDSTNKCFLLFLTAVFWFYPVMWIAKRCSFDDLELSCDEAVLQDFDQQTRKKYAELLLNTAGDQRGFTTCLSASARALRYRLKNVMVPKKKYRGSLLAAVLMILLCMTVFFCGFGYATETAAEQIFDNRDLGLYTLVDECVIGDDQGITEYPNINLEAVMGYLYQMPVSKLMNEVDVFAGSREMQLIVHHGEEKFFIGLSTKYLWVRTYPNGEAQDTYYVLKEEVDWDTLKNVLNQQ